MVSDAKSRRRHTENVARVRARYNKGAGPFACAGTVLGALLALTAARS